MLVCSAAPTEEGGNGRSGLAAKVGVRSNLVRLSLAARSSSVNLGVGAGGSGNGLAIGRT